MAGVDYKSMWIKVKTHGFEKKEDICKILELNKVTELNHAFEIILKDVIKVSQNQTADGLDMVVINTHVAPLFLHNDSPITLFRQNKKLSNVCFVNVKNDKEERFSSLFENLGKNDRILITNGVICKNNVKLSSTRFTVAVRPENHSTVFLLKFGISNSDIADNIPVTLPKNLSQITQQGVYSFFGHVKKIVILPDENCMFLRLVCCDKSCIKTFKYPHFDNEVMSNSTKEKNYDQFSNEVDVLVKNPGIAFTSLVLGQRVLLQNVKVKSFNYLDIFLFKVTGVKTNLNADPKETTSVNSLRPPRKPFPIPNELKPAVKRFKTNQIKNSPIKELLSIGNQRKHQPMEVTFLSSDDDMCLSPVKKSPTLRTSIVLSDLSDDETVCLPPYKKLSTLQNKEKNGHDFNENVNPKPSSSSYISSKINHKNSELKSSPEKLESKPQTKSQHQKYCESNPKISIQIKTETNSSPEKSSNDSCSPPFFQNYPEVAQTVPSNQQTPSKQLNFNSSNPTECLGPCRLVFTDPNVCFTDEIVFGYCVNNCFSFFPLSVLIKNSRLNKYICPKCNDVVHLSFFFKMNFLYGKKDSSAIEVCCYGENAQHVLKKLTKKSISAEDCLSNNNDRKLIIDTLKMFISNKTKVNIVISDSPNDETKLLLSIDTKYVITSLC